MKEVIYVDNGATTQVSDIVFDSMVPYLKAEFGNASSVHVKGRNARKAIDEARAKVAKAIGAKPNEIYFTSCATESNNWAIKGAMYEMKKKGKNHIITSAIEHHAVLHTVEQLEKDGFTVTIIPVDSDGLISASDVEKAITDQTGLVTIMYANNEIGTIEPIEEIGKICRDKKVLFHTDAVQAIGNVEIDVNEQNIDMLSLSGHKFHAPKGIGALYIKQGVKIGNYLSGGHQERGKRGGTENVPYIVGLGVAIEEVTKNVPERVKYIKGLSDKLIKGLDVVTKTKLNGHKEKRLAGNVNISFSGIEGEGILLIH